MNGAETIWSINSRLRMAIGDRVDTLTDGEREVGRLVLDWAQAYIPQIPMTGKLQGDVITVSWAIKGVISAYSMLPWENICSNRRMREYAEYRYIAASLLYELSSVKKSGLARALGFERVHTTILYGMKKCDEWRQYDGGFRKKYDDINFLVRMKLKEGYKTNTDNSTNC